MRLSAGNKPGLEKGRTSSGGSRVSLGGTGARPAAGAAQAPPLPRSPGMCDRRPVIMGNSLKLRSRPYQLHDLGQVL